MKPLTKEKVKFQLGQIGYQKEFTVIFTKTNGEQRKMRCMMDVPTGPAKGRGSDNVVPVMDLEKGAWRSFKIENVLYIGENV